MTNLCQTRFSHNQGVAVRYNNNIYQTTIETLIKGFARGIRCKCEPVNLISSQKYFVMQCYVFIVKTFLI